MPVYQLAATLMRGGTSKGLFFRGDSLPADPTLREQLLSRAIGSPDPYGKQIDGLGCGTSSTSKVVIVSPSQQPGHDVDYLFGHIGIASGQIDWSGNCGNLSAAVAPFALLSGLLPTPAAVQTTVRIWQVNTRKTIVATVPLQDGRPAMNGNFWLDGVPFAGAGVTLDFLDPAGGAGGLFPSGAAQDRLRLPDGSALAATLIDAGNPTVIVRAADIGLRGDELQPEINSQPALLARLEQIRAAGAVAMGLAADAASASRDRPGTPKIAFVAPPLSYTASDGRNVAAADIDLCARIVSMGQLHHAFTGTGTIALAAAAALPGTLVAELLGQPLTERALRFGHVSGVNQVAAELEQVGGGAHLRAVRLVRSARPLMSGQVYVPLP